MNRSIDVLLRAVAALALALLFAGSLAPAPVAAQTTQCDVDPFLTCADIPVAGDAYVSDDHPTTNYNGSTVYADQDSDQLNAYVSVPIPSDLGGLTNVDAVQLCLHFFNGTTGEVSIDWLDNGFNEQTVTWN